MVVSIMPFTEKLSEPNERSTRTCLDLTVNARILPPDEL
jgi:hypothetical protein